MATTSTRNSPRHPLLRRHPLAVGCAAALFVAASAHAQDSGSATAQSDSAAPTETQPADAKKRTGKTVTLTKVEVKGGIRRGIEDSIANKQSATSIVESVSAEDIGKLPDVSIAESIARLPGLAAQRVAGRAQVISVRGLSPDFATTLLNGRELVSTGDNRSVEFDQYPSELFGGVTVYKTPDAGLVGQGLSGTLDMHTVRPLDFDHSVTALSMRGQHNSLGSAANADGTGTRFNASYIGQNSDRTVGYSIGYSYSDTPIQEEQVGLYEPWQSIGAGWRPGVPAGTFYSDGIKALRRTGYTRRSGVMGTLEFRPNDNWTSILDVFHSQSVQEDTANQFEVHLGGYNGGYSPGLSLSDVIVNDNGTFVGGVASGVYPLVRGMYNKRKDKINAIGWNNQFHVGEALITADLSWSKANRDEVNLENNTQLLPAPQLDSLTVHYSGNDFSQLTPGMDYSNPGSLYLANTIYGSGYGKTPTVEDQLKSFRLNANLPTTLGFFSDVDFGLNYADRKKEKHQPEGNINLGSQGVTTIASDLQYGLVDLGFAGVGMIPSWNVPGAVAKYMVFNPSEDSAGYLIAKTWIVNEKITTGYVKGNIDTDWGSVPVRGNLGLQLQHVDQSSDGRAFLPPAEVVPYTRGKTYTDVLPSLNLAFSLQDDLMLRVALARQVARPRVDQMRASLDFSVDKGTGNTYGSTGNAELDPWRANAFDISLEKYFSGTKGYVAAAYFFKDLKTYIFTQSIDGYDFAAEIAGYVPPNDCGSPAGPCPAAKRYGTYTEPLNGNGGRLQGLELSASIPLDMISSSLEGFGIIANASFNDSSIAIRDPDSSSSVGGGDIALPGLSKRVYNLTAYYEHNGFEFRINNRRRSDFIGEIGNFAGNRTLRYVEGENITDAQVSYNFSGQYDGLSLLLQGSNLTDSAYRTYATSKDRPLENIKWGRTYLLGISYKF